MFKCIERVVFFQQLSQAHRPHSLSISLYKKYSRKNSKTMENLKKQEKNKQKNSRSLGKNTRGLLDDTLQAGALLSQRFCHDLTPLLLEDALHVLHVHVRASPLAVRCKRKRLLGQTGKAKKNTFFSNKSKKHIFS